jgi:glycosyltransferase involved in cell wall biosynthesis
MAFPDAFVNAKRMGSLPGFDVDVVCGEPPPGWEAEDHSLDTYVAECFGQVVRVRRSRVWDVVRFGRFYTVLSPPDQFRLLNGPARRAAGRMLRRGGYAAVVTWSQMHSVQLVGRAVQRRFGLPWLAYLGDPWASNPFLSLNRLERRLNIRFERRVFAAADRLLFPSSETFERTLAAYPDSWRSKVHVIPHAFEPRLYPERRDPRRGDGRLLLRFLGAFYGRRTPGPLVAALDRLATTDPDLLGRVRVEIVGRVEPGMLEAAGAQRLPTGTLEVRPHVDYARSLELMVEADGLLVVDAPAEKSAFLPSKLVDYVGSGRPIAALTPDGPAAELTRRLGGPVADPSDPKAGAEALRQLLLLADRANSSPFGSAAVRKEYSAESGGAKMAQIVEELIREAGR